MAHVTNQLSDCDVKGPAVGLLDFRESSFKFLLIYFALFAVSMLSLFTQFCWYCLANLFLYFRLLYCVFLAMAFCAQKEKATTPSLCVHFIYLTYIRGTFN